LGQPLLNTGSFFPYAPHLGRELLLGPVWITDQIEVAVLLDIQLAELVGKLLTEP